MAQRDRYIPGVPCWVDTNQPDPEAAVAFYGGLFGWEFEDVMPPASPGHYSLARVNGADVAAVGSAPLGETTTARWNTYVWVHSAQESAAKVAAAGGSVVTEPFEVMDAGRTAAVADPEGAVLHLWEARRHRAHSASTSRDRSISTA